MKVFKQQLVESKVALTSLFIGGFAQILPYANALLMVIKEVCKAIAMMFGIELKDYNSGIATQEDMYDDLADSADNATGSIKELKRQVLGFDQIHNINENKDNGSGGGVSGGIDQRLLDAIKGYDNGMDKVRMKATEIRDKIMEWLGFTKKINPLTGETYFEYQGIQKTLKNMWNSFKGLSTQGKILVGLGLVTGAVKLFNAGKKLVTVFGNSGLVKITKNLLSPTKTLIPLLRDDLAGGFKGLSSSIGDSINMWSKSLSMMDKFKMTLVGTGGLILSMNGMSSAMKSVSNEGWNLGNSLQTVASGLGGVASGALVGGSVFGAWGAVIGGAIGAVGMLISAIQGYETETDKMVEKSKTQRAEVEEYLNSLNEQDRAIEQNIVSNMALTNSHEKLLEELKSITDENGNVKKGYEERADFILSVLNNAYGTEYKLIDGQIEKYQELVTNIKDAIEAKKAEILLNANEEKYAKALEEEARLYSEKQKAQDKVNELLSEQDRLQNIINNIVPNGDLSKMQIKNIDLYNKTVKSLHKVQDELGNWQVTLDNTTNKYIECLDTQFKYSDLQEAVISGNLEEIEEATKNFTNSYVTENGVVTLTLDQRMAKELEAKDYITNLYKDASDEKKEILENSSNSSIQTTIDELVGMSNTVDNLSDEVINSWGVLSSKSEDKFIENFKKLNPDIQQQIINKMYEKGYSISSELQRGIQQMNPTIRVTADTSSAKWSIDNLFDNIARQINIGGVFDSLGSLLRREKGGVFSNGSWSNIKQYANGGSPSHGTAFVAGEHGAEIVGHINGRTEVLNQSQIASTIYSAMISAMTRMQQQAVQVELDLHTDEGVVVDRINQKTKQTGVCPIDIPY